MVANKPFGCILVVLAALAIGVGGGCGGGGGGSSSNGSTNATGTTATTSGVDGFSSVRVSGQLSGSQSVDPTNVQVGDAITLRVIGLNSQGQTVYLTASNYRTNAPSSVATVTSDGVLTANGSSGNATYTITGSVGNVDVSSVFRVLPVQATVTGRIRNVNNAGVGGVRVRFFTAAKAQVGEALTGADGTFRASLPTTAVSFTLDVESADPPNTDGDTIYFRQFSFAGEEYLNADTTCYAAIPALTIGQTTALSTPISLSARISGPPPPPSGACLGGGI